MPSARLPTSLLLVPLLVLVAPGAACSGGRSPDLEAFCAGAAQARAMGNPLALLGERSPERLEPAMAEAVELYDTLFDRAPDAIADGVETVRDALRVTDDALADHDYDGIAANADVVDGLGGAAGLEAVGQAGSRVEKFVRKQCPGAVPTTSPSTSTTLSVANP